MVHADATNFSPTLSKPAAYTQLHTSLLSLLSSGQRNWVAALANAASLLWHLYHSFPFPSSPLARVNWAGFYVRNHHRNVEGEGEAERELELILGPFQGKVACQTIRWGRGVCGTAAARGQTVRVGRVEEFAGHIACDGETRSEVVVPIFEGGSKGKGEVVGVIDIDCAEEYGFDEEDQRGLERVAEILGEACDWP